LVAHPESAHNSKWPISKEKLMLALVQPPTAAVVAVKNSGWYEKEFLVQLALLVWVKPLAPLATMNPEVPVLRCSIVICRPAAVS